MSFRKKLIVNGLICCFTLILVTSARAQDNGVGSGNGQSTKAISLKYLQLDSEMNYASLEQLYVADATFWDPTGEVFDGEVAKGIIRGAQDITNLQRGWGLKAIRFAPDVSFYAGTYALHRGTYHAKFEGSDAWVEIPFVTIHQVVNGKVQSRMDFGEYIQSFGMGNGFDETMKSTSSVADTYIEAYLDENFETQASLMDTSITFQDPTASAYGPSWGNPIHSPDQLIANRRKVFQNIQDFGFDIETQFVSNHHKVIMGHVRYTTGDGSKYNQPAVFVVEVRNGKVTRHWDFVDYSVGPTS
ncbi:nuclear transport factor 2 family protein [bacterium]|nr:nuclear transport factor 2 family protein [bacterium]